MRILFCTKNDLFGAVILNWVLPRLQGHEVRVLLSDKTRPTENTLHELQEEKFLERDLPISMVFPLLDVQHQTAPCLTMQGIARKYQVPVETTMTINDPRTEQGLREWGPDIIVSARFSLIFKSNILAIPRHGVFNIHPGALPGYGGLFAPLRALLHREDRLGCTLHQVDTGIDTGPVYSVSYLPAQPEKSVFWHIDQLYILGLTSLLTLLEHAEQGISPQLQVQDVAAMRYFGMPGKEEFAELRQMGYQMVCYKAYREVLQRFWPDFQI